MEIGRGDGDHGRERGRTGKQNSEGISKEEVPHKSAVTGDEDCKGQGTVSMEKGGGRGGDIDDNGDWKWNWKGNGDGKGLARGWRR